MRYTSDFKTMPSGYTEWVRPVHAHKGAYRFGCCDCGLVHDMQFRVVSASEHSKKQVVVFRARRNNRSTAAMRRGMK